MRAPYWANQHATLYRGDTLEVLREMPDSCVDCVVTSPPYYGLRDYGKEGQYGSEETPQTYVEVMRQVFSEAHRVLAADGTLWLNLGDSYISGPTGTRRSSGLMGTPNSANTREGMGEKRGWGLPGKSLMGIPWRVAFALQGDGWILRQEIIWFKPNAMPTSARDRFAPKHEQLFLFAKSPRYHFDLGAATVPSATRSRVASRKFRNGSTGTVGATSTNAVGWRGTTRTMGDVWRIPTVPYPGAHFAVWPPKLAERCVSIGCKPGGVVLDPFSGSGSTGVAAIALGRKYVGIDLNPTYHDLAVGRFLKEGIA